MLKTRRKHLPTGVKKPRTSWASKKTSREEILFRARKKEERRRRKEFRRQAMRQIKGTDNRSHVLPLPLPLPTSDVVDGLHGEHENDDIRRFITSDDEVEYENGSDSYTYDTLSPQLRLLYAIDRHGPIQRNEIDEFATSKLGIDLKSGHHKLLFNLRSMNWITPASNPVISITREGKKRLDALII